MRSRYVWTEGRGLVTSRNRRGLLGRLLDSERQLRVGSISKSQDGEAPVLAGLRLDRRGDGTIQRSVRFAALRPRCRGLGLGVGFRTRTRLGLSGGLFWHLDLERQFGDVVGLRRKGDVMATHVSLTGHDAAAA
jgi:hypothetical protein